MIIYVILFSLIAGSFAGVLVYRVPIKEKIIFSRSRCDFCEHRIFFYNNICFSGELPSGLEKKISSKIRNIYL